MGDVTQAALFDADQVAEHIAKLPGKAAVCLIDTDQGSLSRFHLGVEQLFSWNESRPKFSGRRRIAAGPKLSVNRTLFVRHMSEQ